MNPSLKTLLGVGGWNFGTAKMTAMLATKGNRREFAKTTAEYLRKYGFNGIDLDFEYPGSRGSPAGDKDRFASLCEVRIATKQHAPPPEEFLNVTHEAERMLRGQLFRNTIFLESDYPIILSERN